MRYTRLRVFGLSWSKARTTPHFHILFPAALCIGPLAGDDLNDIHVVGRAALDMAIGSFISGATSSRIRLKNVRGLILILRPGRNDNQK